MRTLLKYRGSVVSVLWFLVWDSGARMHYNPWPIEQQEMGGAERDHAFLSYDTHLEACVPLALRRSA
jgi:hypothetical protein